jgi:AcrR family transcriptional regulator
MNENAIPLMSINADAIHTDQVSVDAPILPHDPRPTRADAVKNREHLLETARALFAQHGASSVSMSAIAEAAQVGKGTLYRHFPGKAQLCHELLHAEQRDLQDRTLAMVRTNPDALACLHTFLREALEFVTRNHELMFDQYNAALLVSLDHPAHLWWRQTIRGLLARLAPTLDLDYAADVLYVLLDPRTVHFQTHAHHFSTDRILDGLLHTCDGLIAPR